MTDKSFGKDFWIVRRRLWSAPMEWRIQPRNDFPALHQAIDRMSVLGEGSRPRSAPSWLKRSSLASSPKLKLFYDLVCADYAPIQEVRGFWIPLAIAFADFEETAQKRRTAQIRNSPDFLPKRVKDFLSALQALKDPEIHDLLRTWTGGPHKRVFKEARKLDIAVEVMIDQLGKTMPSYPGPYRFARNPEPIDTDFRLEQTANEAANFAPVDIRLRLEEAFRYLANPDLNNVEFKPGRSPEFWARAFVFILGFAFYRITLSHPRKSQALFKDFVERSYQAADPNGKQPVEKAIKPIFDSKPPWCLILKKRRALLSDFYEYIDEILLAGDYNKLESSKMFQLLVLEASGHLDLWPD